VNVERIPLPGIGLRHEFTTARGRRVGVVTHRTGRRDLLVYAREDPDRVAETVPLSVQEADALADLLSQTRIVEGLAALHRQVEGLVSEQILLAARSPYDGRTLGDTRARTRTGASIVAVVRGPDVVASPRPDFVFHAADVVVVVGDAEGTAAVAALLRNG
jgi:TrkA domain protein